MRYVRADATGPTGPPAGTPERLDGLLVRLRAAAARYGRAQRAAGVPPAQVRERLRTLVRGALAAEGCHDPGALGGLTAHVVQWCGDAS